jgi:hypothetical protein
LTNPQEVFLAAAIAVIGYFTKRVLNDIRGLSRKLNKVLALLQRWRDLSEAERTAQISHIQEGK